MSSQFRKHLKFEFKHHLRLWWKGKRLAACGKRVYFDDNVKIMRFPKNVSLGSDVAIKEGARICACNPDAKIRIGNNTTIGYHTFIFASSSISIGDDCLIAPFVYLVDSNHQIKAGQKINEQPNESKPITIGNDVWIGSNVTILKGVSIGDGAVIGANSLVNADVSANSIVAGTPAKIIGKRE
jgi:acetyltransferase-like isoleucine patch superfamily enzyme